MDTVYYNLKTRRVKAAGGEELVTFVPVPTVKPAGEILDFERCRQKLERKNAWKELERAAYAPRESAPVREETGERAVVTEYQPFKACALRGQWLELAATLSVTLVSLSAAFAFFRLA